MAFQDFANELAVEDILGFAIYDCSVFMYYLKGLARDVGCSGSGRGGGANSPPKTFGLRAGAGLGFGL